MLEDITENDWNESDDGKDDDNTSMLIFSNTFERLISTCRAISRALKSSNVIMDAFHKYRRTLNIRKSTVRDVATPFDSTL